MLKKIIFRNTKFQWNLVVLKKTREKKEEYQKLFSPMEPIFGSFWRKFGKHFFVPLPSYPFLEMGKCCNIIVLRSKQTYSPPQNKHLLFYHNWSILKEVSGNYLWSIESCRVWTPFSPCISRRPTTDLSL